MAKGPRSRRARVLARKSRAWLVIAATVSRGWIGAGRPEAYPTASPSVGASRRGARIGGNG